jgi:hypothetical protein
MHMCAFNIRVQSRRSEPPIGMSAKEYSIYRTSL